MKKIYLILLAIPLLSITLMYLSPAWFILGMGILMAIIAYQFYLARFQSVQTRNLILEENVDQLNVQLERAVLKEEKAKKDAQQLREMKQQFLSVLSHEIRTPMNGVLGTALLLEDTVLSSEQRSYIETIRHCGENLITSINNLLINDILSFSKLHDEEQKLVYHNFNLRDSIEEVIGLFGKETVNKGVDLIYHMGDNVPEQLIGDSKRIRQVLTNLIENAVRYTHHGQIMVNVQVYAPVPGQGSPQLSFEIIDSGVGIGRDQLKNLFKGIDPNSAKQKSQGAGGLGLAICKKLVEMMGGEISAESDGNGSRFRFIIPVTPSLKSLRGHAREKDMPAVEGKTILLVDDNQQSLSVIGDMLLGWKASVVPASSGKQALELLSRVPVVDAVLVDPVLAGENAQEVLASIKTLLRNKPVAFLQKPVQQRVLLDTVLAFFLDDENSQESADRPAAMFATDYPLRILIAEDNVINQKIATKILSSLGYETSLANNGKEVVEMAGNESYDLILMDVQMPEMNGLEATRMLRICLPVQPVIIALTANAMQGDRDECMQAGMDDYMSKPIEIDELMRQLQKWYRARKASNDSAL